MRNLLLAGLLLASLPAAAQQSVTGARPGNEIGTGQSLPTSNKASNTLPSDTTSTIAPRLPAPDLPANAGTREFLMAAQSHLQANRTGAAQEALERAESRALSRSVVVGQADIPSRQSVVQTIGAARRALAAGNRTSALELVAVALKDSSGE